MTPPLDAAERNDRDIERQAEMDRIRLREINDGYTWCLKCGHQIARGEDLEKHRKYCEGWE